MNLAVPILFLVFRRPETTARVFETIRQVRPSRLYVAADGPRRDRAGEREMCEQVRRIATAVDWDCDVFTLFRDENLGCRQAVSSAIDWFFAQEEEGIVLEDDCLPAPSFFAYCEELLPRYRNDTRIMQVCGSNLLELRASSGHSYLFSGYGPVWGWASWRRAWCAYDVDMKLWPEVREKGLCDHLCQSPEEARFRGALYDRLYSGDIDTWDYQWGFAKMINMGLSIVPSSNLISNIGFGADSTHTTGTPSYAAAGLVDVEVPLNHPPYVIRDRLYDAAFNSLYVPARRSILGHLRAALSRALGDNHDR